MADRYHYLPSIGTAIMIAWGIPALLRMTGRMKKLLISGGNLLPYHPYDFNVASVWLLAEQRFSL